MIMHCPYCEYHYDIETPKYILEALGQHDLPSEDWYLWMERLCKVIGFHELHGVKIHVGIKHPAEINCYQLEFNREEEKLIEAAGTNIAKLTY